MAVDLTWFRPENVQQQFITEWHPEQVYAGGVGSGKTLSGGIKALMATQQWPGGVGLVGRQTYRALEDTTKKVLVYGDDKPPIFDEQVGHYVAKDDAFHCRNGSVVLFRALEDHNIEKLLSLNLAWVYVDEMTETTLKIWLTLLGRLRHPAGPGCAWGTTNPNGHDWVWRRFHEDAGVTSPDRKMWIQPTMSNPHLPRHYLRRMMGMPDEWKKRFVFASFDTAAGAIWDRYDSKIHVFDPFELAGGDRFPAHWKRFEAMDHGRRNPTAWMWFCVDPDGFLIVEDEYYEAGLLPSEHAPAIHAQRQAVAPNIRWAPSIAPPDCFRQGNDGRTVADEYRDATQSGIILSQGNDNVDAGLLRVSEWLQRDPTLDFPEWHPWARTKGPDGLGSPRLFISKRCANLRNEIPDYRWKDLSPSAEEHQDQPEAPRKKDDHACDALRYGVMSRPRPFQELTADDVDRRSSVAGSDESPTAGIIDMVF